MFIKFELLFDLMVSYNFLMFDLDINVYELMDFE